jgi:hypothetical protein
MLPSTQHIWQTYFGMSLVLNNSSTWMKTSLFIVALHDADI